jgi:glycosyltransferase involved in cell wall biosynthesis
MHVAIDYTSAVSQGAGIGRYTRSLVRALARLDAENRYTLFVAGGWGEGDGQGAWPRNFQVRGVPLTDRVLNILWQRLRFPVPIQAITGRIDLFHSPDFVLPPVIGQTPAILTVHDLSFLRVPTHFVPGFRSYLEGAVSRAIKHARHILADSKSTRRDLVELLGVGVNRITVIYPGVEPRFAPVSDAGILESVTKRYQLPENFVLGLGTLQPRKNFEGLIAAFHSLVTNDPGTEELSDLQLVIGGGPGWLHEEIARTVKRCGLEERVRLVGYVRDQDLPALYSLAAVFAFPSWYEGFGLPVLEAQACGTPVVAANNSSLPEVVGSGGVLVDAASRDALAGALLHVLTDSSHRAELVSSGRAQAARFSWEKAAQQLLVVYQRFGSESQRTEQ